VLESGNLQSLIISGSPSESELEDAWSEIYSEFSEIIKDNGADLQFLHIKQATAKKHRISYLSVLLQIYAQTPTPQFAEVLENEGFKISSDVETTYRMAFGRLKKMQNDLDFEEKLKDKSKPHDFEMLISELERFQGYQFDQEKMTVRHFANIYKRFKNERKNRA
jgi:hypothetical protein